MPRMHDNHPLTSEQNAAVDLALKMHPTLAVEAFAGAGKTSTLAAIATALAFEAQSTYCGTYLAFNKAIVTDAHGQFPPTTDVRTMHSLAYRAMVRQLPNMGERLKTRLNGKKLAYLLDLQPFGPFSADGLGSLVLDTLSKFCNSADDEVLARHVPSRVRDRIEAAAKANNPATVAVLADMETRGVSVQDGQLVGPATAADRAWLQTDGADLDVRAEVQSMREHVAGITAELFEQMRSRADTPLTHDAYLKLWALSRPQLDADYVLFDEAQDASPVMLGVLGHQTCSVIFVGDRYQEIYGWRGAVNALEKTGTRRCQITQSFRFGQSIADLATAIICGDLGANASIRGFQKVQSRVITDGTSKLPDAVLGRTNAAVLGELLTLSAQGRRCYLVGNANDYRWMVESVGALASGRPATHPELADFADWAELKAYTETDSGRDLASIVKAVETYGEAQLIQALRSLAQSESAADVVLSTAHKAKGRQWSRVRLLGDFMLATDAQGEDRSSRPWSPEESRITYVAATRAKHELDVSACRGLRKLADNIGLPVAA